MRSTRLEQGMFVCVCVCEAFCLAWRKCEYVMMSFGLTKTCNSVTKSLTWGFFLLVERWVVSNEVLAGGPNSPEDGDCSCMMMQCDHQNDSAFGWAEVWAIWIFYLWWRAQSQDSVHKSELFDLKGGPKGIQTWVLLLTTQAPVHWDLPRSRIIIVIQMFLFILLSSPQWGTADWN